MTPAEALHAAACRRLRLDGHGSYAAVASYLEVDRANYHGAVTNRRPVSLDTLAGWAGQLGIVVCCYPAGRVEYLATPLEHAQQAIELVERIPRLLGEDHPTAHAETDHIVHHMGDLVRWLDVPDEEE